MIAAELTGRQQRELEYHRGHAAQHRGILEKPLDLSVVSSSRRHWWNAYWEMFAILREERKSLGRVLVVGCGFGDDAVRLAKLGAEVHAFDLSPDSLSIARELAARNGVQIDFRELPAERLDYPDRYFDCVVMRDILHHVDIAKTLAELRRVSAPQALWLVNEIYSHSWTERIRRSMLVERALYPALRAFIYKGEKPYITEDERKMTEHDLAKVRALLRVDDERYFNAIVTRLLPDKWETLNKIDQILLRALPVGKFIGGRALISGRLF